MQTPRPPANTLTRPTHPGWLAHQARTANAATLTTLLQDCRARTLAGVQAYADALGPELKVCYDLDLNPPLWELGHIGWFQEHWIARNPQRALGILADPDCPRRASVLSSADALYDSSQVAHPSRWSLPLPDLQATCDYLAESLQITLTQLNASNEDDAGLYFYRLALFHEDMHCEAAVYMAQSLGVPLPETLQPPPKHTFGLAALRPCLVPAGDWHLGSVGQDLPGFCFDNELGSLQVNLPAYEIDSNVVTWARYLAFFEAAATPGAENGPAQIPRYLRRRPAVLGTSATASAGLALGTPLVPFEWEQCRFGQWHALNLDAPASHLSYAEVQAWCQWAGRQLPTEAQWEKAALTQPGFQWGQVWEWTASPFEAFPGFVTHPYRDYSAPWFGSRQVLRGASNATVGRMAHPRYRNFFTPERTDIYAGFRTCIAA